MPETDSRPVPIGQIRVTPQSGGWWLIEIGRARKLKRLYLSDAEYRQLIEIYPGPA